MSTAARNDCPYHVKLHPDEQCTCPPDRARIYALPPLSQEQIAAAIQCASRECDHGIVHPLPGVRTLLATVIARDAELLRLNGPVCPHDGKRASEHKRCVRQGIGCKQGGAPIHVCAPVEHAAWPDGEEWLRSPA